MSPARKFLAPNGRMASKPLRELHDGGDPPEVVERIAEARALCDEPECVSRAIIDAKVELSKRQEAIIHFATVDQAKEDRKRLSVEARMADVQRRAKLRHFDVSHEFHVMRRDLERGRRGGVEKPPTVVGRLERLEAQLDHRPDLEAA